MTPAPASLSIQVVTKVIQYVCHVVNEKQSNWNFRCAEESDCSSTLTDTDKVSRYLFGLVTSVDEKTRCLTTFCIVFSTWDGRVLCLDKLGLGELSNDSDISLCLRQVLSSIAVKLQCRRLTWNHYGEAIDYVGQAQADTHHEVLTLYWESDIMKRYINHAFTENRVQTTTAYKAEIASCLELPINPPPGVNLRICTSDDLATIGRLVKALADYAQEPDSVNITSDYYRNDGFQTQMPLFYCLLLEQKNSDDENYAFGMAFFFVGYTHDAGAYLYLEDFFIEEQYRGKGAGKFVMRTLASIALAINCSRMIWLSLDWNVPALSFYGQIGAQIQKGLKTSRLGHEALRSFAIYADN